MPLRRCVGCGRIAPKPDLVRIAVVDSGHGRPAAAIDRAGTMPGRGAYVCRDQAGRPKRGCLTSADRRNAIPRALRRAVEVPVKLLESVGQ